MTLFCAFEFNGNEESMTLVAIYIGKGKSPFSISLVLRTPIFKGIDCIHQVYDTIYFCTT